MMETMGMIYANIRLNLSRSASTESSVFHRLIPPSTALRLRILRKSMFIYPQERGKTVVKTVSGPFVAVSRVKCTPGNGSEA